MSVASALLAEINMAEAAIVGRVGELYVETAADFVRTMPVRDHHARASIVHAPGDLPADSPDTSSKPWSDPTEADARAVLSSKPVAMSVYATAGHVPKLNVGFSLQAPNGVTGPVVGRAQTKAQNLAIELTALRIPLTVVRGA